MHYKVVLVFAVQCESVISMHISPPFGASLPPPIPLKKNMYHIFIYIYIYIYIYGVYKNDPETCFLKDQRVNISGCMGHMVSAFLA